MAGKDDEEDPSGKFGDEFDHSCTGVFFYKCGTPVWQEMDDEMTPSREFGDDFDLWRAVRWPGIGFSFYSQAL